MLYVNTVTCMYIELIQKKKNRLTITFINTLITHFLYMYMQKNLDPTFCW